ncbi:MAG: cyclase [Actinomycetota bacterium]
MTILVVHHRVRAFDAWKPVFDAHADSRREHGARRHWLYTAPADRNDVVVAVEFPSADAANGFLADPSLAGAMERAGVEGEPMVHIWEQVEDVTY